MVLGAAGDVAVDVPVLLEATRDAGDHQRLERSKDGGAPDARLAAPKPIVQVLGGDPATHRSKGVGDEQPLARDALASGGKPIGG